MRILHSAIVEEVVEVTLAEGGVVLMHLLVCTVASSVAELHCHLAPIYFTRGKIEASSGGDHRPHLHPHRLALSRTLGFGLFGSICTE